MSEGKNAKPAPAEAPKATAAEAQKKPSSEAPKAAPAAEAPKAQEK